MAAYSPFQNYPAPVWGGGALTGSTGSTGGGFNINPGTQSGSGPFGAVPGAVGAITPAQVAQPPDPFKTLSGLYPNLSGANASSSDFINSELAGKLSPGTINALTNLSASRGISSGMGPGAGLWDNALLGNVAGATESLQQHGLSDLGSFLTSMSKNETITPELQAQINEANAQLKQAADLANQKEAERNAAMKAAPNPAAAQSYAQQLFQQYLNSMGGPAGGSGSWSKGPWTPAQRPGPVQDIHSGMGGWGGALDLTQGGYGPAYMNSGGWNGSASGDSGTPAPTPAGGNLYSGNWGDNSPGVYMGANDKPWMSDPFGDVMDPSNGDFGDF